MMASGSIRMVAASAEFGFRICPELRQPEIQDLHPSVRGDEDVLRLQVAMNHALAIRRCQAMRDLRRKLRGLAHRQRPGAHLLAQRFAFEQFTDEIRRALVNARVVNGQYVRMIQRRQRLGLLLEAPQPIGIGDKILRQDLDGHVAVQPRVPRAKHFTHPARANPRGDLILVK